MLHFLVVVAETLLVVSLLLGMLMGFAWQRRLFEVRTPAKRGAALGLLAAVVLAALKMNTGFVVREYYNLAVLSVMIPAELLLLLVLYLRRSFSSERAASPLMRALFFLVAATWAAYYLPDIFIFPSHFAVGVIQVVSSEFVFIVVGYLIGLLLAAFTCLTAYKVSLAVPLRVLYPLMSAALLIFAIYQFIALGQLLLGRGLLPRSDWALDLIIFMLNSASLLLLPIAGIAAALALYLWAGSRRTRPEGDNAAEKRKSRSVLISRMRWSRAGLLALLLGSLVLTVGVYFNNLVVELSPPARVEAADGRIRLPLTLVGDGKLHRFVYTSGNGVDIRYIVIKKNESAYGVGLDACDVCGAGGGYYERKGQVVCILCDVVMNKATIGFAGGCNPVPLPFAVENGYLVIKIEDLEAEESRFL